MIFKSEIFDKLQFLFETYKINDHNLHCIINFNGNIDKVILEKTMMMMLDVAPILSCKYVEDSKEPYWETVGSSGFKDVLTFVKTQSEFNSFMTSKTNEVTGPQMKACLLNSDNDCLGILMNHIVCDGAGFKKYIYTLCDLYSHLLKDQDYKPDNILNGDRSLNIINKQFRFKDKLKALIFQNEKSNGSTNLKFPMSTEREVEPFIVTHEVHEDRFLSIKNYCKNHKVTINDVTLAAFYRVLYKISGKQDLSISIAVDMRKHLKDKDTNALSNLTAMVISNLSYGPNDTLDDTVEKVHEEMSFKKENIIGLNSFVKISLVFKLFNYKQIKKLFENKFENPLIGMTNIGVLDFKRLYFEGTQIRNALMFGSIKYRPYFQVALTTYNNIMTFTINLYGNSNDKENIENFLLLLDEELPG